MFARQIRCDASRWLVCHVAEKYCVSERTVRYWARTGQLRAVRIGRRAWKFDPKDVEKFMRDRAIRAEAA